MRPYSGESLLEWAAGADRGGNRDRSAKAAAIPPEHGPRRHFDRYDTAGRTSPSVSWRLYDGLVLVRLIDPNSGTAVLPVAVQFTVIVALTSVGTVENGT